MIKYFILINSLLITCCEEPMPEPKPTLPPITQEGKNTLGFLLNGEVWLPETPFPNLSGSIKLACGISRSTRHLVLHTTRYISIRDGINPARDSVRQEMTIGIGPIETIGRQNFAELRSSFFNYNGTCHTYRADTILPYYINILKYDSIKQIIAGTMQFNLINDFCKDTLQVSDGRFDVRY